MQLAHFARALGLLLVLGLAGCVVGCGSGARERAAADWQAQKDIRAEIRKKKMETAAASKGGALRRGKSGAKSGP
jgi:hypothetical protein